MTNEMIHPEDKPGFRSYAKATWRDLHNVEHTRYMIRPMKPGPGFEVIDTNNNANWSVVSNFRIEADGREWLRINRTS
jgi:hypothetical protein